MNYREFVIQVRDSFATCSGGKATILRSKERERSGEVRVFGHEVRPFLNPVYFFLSVAQEVVAKSEGLKRASSTHGRERAQCGALIYPWNM